MGTAAALVLVALCACSSQPRTPEARLAAELEGGHVERLAERDFDQIVVEPFRALYADYVAQPLPVVSGHVDVRRHFAGDPALSPSQVRLRWMLPVMYPAYVAGGAVFVEVRGSWRTLTGLDEALLARVRVLDAACAERLAMAGPPGSCTDVGWVIADAALRGQHDRFVHACQLAATACANR